MVNSELTVVLTATVRTSLNVARSDPELRLADYRHGLRFWLDLPDTRIRRIIFLENSAYPLGSLEAEARDRNPHHRECEFITLDCNAFPANVHPQTLHYGYTEFQLIDLGLQRSRLYEASPMFVKATGRYTFPRISRLLDRLPSDCEFAGDSRDTTRFRRIGQRLTNSGLLLFSRGFFDAQLRTLYREMEPAPPWSRKQFIEDILFDRLLPLRDRPGVVLRWPVNCDPSGVGANNDSYDSTRKRFNRCIRAIGRVVAPGIWI